MKLTPASRNQHYIRAYEAQAVRLADRTIDSNCLIAADRLVTDWSARSVTELNSADLQAIFALKPELVILGTGVRQQFPAPAIRAAFLAREIGFEAMDNGAACRTFNVLLSEDRHAVLALLFDGVS